MEYQKRINELNAALEAPRYLIHRGEAQRLKHLRSFYKHGLDRLAHAWHGKGYSGEVYREPDHIYDQDLGILGSNSLFELLCTARTDVGRRGLAQFLLHPVAAGEARARQIAVQELRELTALREEMAQIGLREFSDCESGMLGRWNADPIEPYPVLLAPVLRITSILLTALAVVGLLALVPWATLVPLIGGLMAVHVMLGVGLVERVRRSLHAGRDLAPEISILAEGLTILSRQQFKSPKLTALVQCAATAPAPLLRIERITRWMKEREKEWFYGPGLYLMLGTQLAIRAEQWRAQYQKDLPEWIDAWAEFEALQCIATYAHEHRDDVFPEFAPDAVFEARGIGHPLLSAETCVRNNVSFNDGIKFWIISGSNMAGKSTLLRSIGINTVLALAGAPVRAASLTLAPFRVCASISTADSLLEGKSRFMAEVERIRDTITAAGAGPALFLIDEIFSGTNSHDRRIAAEAVVRELIAKGARGAISTHDLALTEIAAIPGLAGENIHMCSRSEADALDFDYQVKPGVNRQSNALAIVRLAGVPV